MRVTQSVIMANINQMLQQGGNAETTLSPGVRFAAQVLSVQDGQLTLMLGKGQTLEAKDLSGAALAAGQNLNFQVTDVGADGKVTVKLVSQESESAADPVQTMLGKLKLQDTAENRQMIRSLVNFQIPVTPENIKAASDMKLQAQTAVKLVEQGTVIPAETEGDTLLKDAVIQMLKASGSKVSSTATTLPKASEGPPIGTDVDGADIGVPEKVPMKPVVVVGSIPEQPKATQLPAAGSPALPAAEPDAETAALPSKAVPTENGAAVKLSSETPVAAKTQTDAAAADLAQTRSQELKTVLGSLNFEKIAFVLKNNLPRDVGTLEAMEQLVFGKKQLSQQVETLLKQLPDRENLQGLKTALKSILSMVNRQGMEDPVQFREQLKSAGHEFRSAMQLLNQDYGTAFPKETLSDVRNSMDFLFRMNESLTYLHVPVQLPGGNSSMDLYIQRDKSGQRRINPDDTRIFISLDTHSLDRVQCLAEIRNQQLSLDFRVADEGVQELFLSHFDELKESLAALGYRNVNMNCHISSVPLTLPDVLHMETSGAEQFDYWV